MAEKKVNTTNEEEKKKKKRLFIIFGSILGAGAIAGASVGIYFAVKPKAQAVKVDVPTIEGLTFKNKQAYVGQDYSTEISIDITKTGENRLPDELKSVKSGNRTITNTEYTYNVADNKESADFKIPGKYIEGDIKIDLELLPPGPVVEYVDLSFTSESCNIKDKEGKDVTQVIKGETFEGVISLNQETDGIHLPSMLDITMGDVPVPLSDYEFNPYTGEFSIVPTGDIEINVEQDNSDAMFIYECVEGTNTFTLLVNPGPSDCKIDWGDEIQPITTGGPYIHTYADISKGKRYTIKVSGVNETYNNVAVSQGTGKQLVSAAYFNNTMSDINIADFGEAVMLEELYINKKSYLGNTIGCENLHTIIIDENNESRQTSLNSNIIVGYNMDGTGTVAMGCSRSVIPDNKNIVGIGFDAFRKSKIKEINIPASIVDIYTNPFKGADYLTKITVDPNSEYFTSRNQSGNECNMITAIKTTDHFRQNEMIAACKSTTIPDDGTVKIIGEGAYCMLSSIKNIDIPDCIEQIDGAAINNCPSLEYINFQSSSNLTKFFYGDVEHISLRNKGQFNGCSSLKSVTVPVNVTHMTCIDEFDGFALFDATNAALTEMVVLPTTPPNLGGGCLFDSSRVPPNLASIYVPDASVDTYKSAPGWSDYEAMIKPLSERSTY